MFGNNLSKAKPDDKINCLYSDKHPEKILQKVNELTNLDIKYYAKVDNKALIKLVDMIGGVEFDVPIDMNYDDRSQNLHIHLKKGLQIIDGKKAEMLLRFRHNNNGTTYSKDYGDNDFGRMKTARNFLLAVAKQTVQVKSVEEITEIVNLAFENIDTNLSLKYILSYLVFLSEFDTSNLEMNQLPGNSVYTNGVWIFRHNPEETTQLFEELRF